MKSTFLALLVASTVHVGINAQQPAAGRPEDAPAAPAAPGSAGIYKTHEELDDTLKKAIAAMTGDTGSARIANTTEYRVAVVHRDKPGAAIAHRGWTELHYVLDGSGTIVTGGTIVRGAGGAGSGSSINGGETHRMQKGDVVIVPAGSSHWYKDVRGGITYLEVRFIAPPAK
jgi:mannose-6-phosphate isomerase-like protein (cupin superfamily)